MPPSRVELREYVCTIYYTLPSAYNRHVAHRTFIHSTTAAIVWVGSQAEFQYGFAPSLSQDDTTEIEKKRRTRHLFFSYIPPYNVRASLQHRRLMAHFPSDPHPTYERTYLKFIRSFAGDTTRVHTTLVGEAIEAQKEKSFVIAGEENCCDS